MATKTESEKNRATTAQDAAGVAITRTDTHLQMREITATLGATLVPESLAHFLEEGYETQRHVKLLEGTYIRGIFVGMEDGELSARGRDGEVPRIKWVYIKVSEQETVRLLGAYNLIAQLERCAIGSPVVIGRGADYALQGGFKCTEYFVLKAKPTAVAGAIDAAKKEGEAREVQGSRVS